MNTSGEAADAVVRIALEGTEVLLKLSGKGALETAKYIYSALKGQKRTKGAARLSGMLRSGKALKVFTFREKDLKKFKDFTVEAFTIVWSNGLDLAPEFIKSLT